jgi:hypothetical protein
VRAGREVVECDLARRPVLGMSKGFKALPVVLVGNALKIDG